MDMVTQRVEPTVGLAINRSRGLVLGRGALSNDSAGRVGRTIVPLSLSSMIYYRSIGGDALRLGR